MSNRYSATFGTRFDLSADNNTKMHILFALFTAPKNNYLRIKNENNYWDKYLRQTGCRATALYIIMNKVVTLELDDYIVSDFDVMLFKKIGNSDNCLKTVEIFQLVRSPTVSLTEQTKNKILSIGAYLAPVKLNFVEREIEMVEYGPGNIYEEAEEVGMKLRVEPKSAFHYCYMLKAQDKLRHFLSSIFEVNKGADKPDKKLYSFMLANGYIFDDTKEKLKKFVKTLGYKHNKSIETMERYIIKDSYAHHIATK